jgi:hypothetical protein
MKFIPIFPLKPFCLLVFTLAILSPSSKAETGAYIAFTTGKTGSPNTDWIYGPTIGAYFDSSHLPVVEWGADIRGIFLGGSGKNQLQSGLLGPRIAAQLPVIPVKPYVEMLVGVGYAQVAPSSAVKFQYQGLIGADVTVLPRIDWRVIEFSYGGLPSFNGGTNPKTISIDRPSCKDEPLENFSPSYRSLCAHTFSIG